MGVMGDDELGMDLTAVDPVRVVIGAKEEMGVMIMGLVVIAKRRGIRVYPESISDMSLGSIGTDMMDELDEGESVGLDEPLQPDITLSSPISPDSPALGLHDVFGDLSRGNNPGSKSRIPQPAQRGGRLSPQAHGEKTTRGHEIVRPESEKERVRTRDTMAFDKVSTWREDSQGTASSGNRTVLQEMMDEFGLG
jgi:hypothetical protein